jgi:hypothetical protein
MSASIRDLFQTLWQSSQVTEAREYVNHNAKVVAKKIDTIAGPYKDVANESLNSARSFANDSLQQVRSVDSLKNFVDVLVGIIMSMIHFIIQVLKRVREYVYRMYHTKYSDARSKVGDLVDSMRSKAIELPNTPVGKSVESASKKLLGDARHEQAVEFIKAEVIPRVYRVTSANSSAGLVSASPSGSVQTDATTEVGSVSPSSRRNSPGGATTKKQKKITKL